MLERPSCTEEQQYMEIYFWSPLPSKQYAWNMKILTIFQKIQLFNTCVTCVPDASRAGHSASLTSLCGISPCFVFVNTAVQFNRAVLWIELLLGCSTLTCMCLVLQTGRLPPWCCWWPAPWQLSWPFWWPWFPSAGGRRDGTTAPWLCSSSLQVRLSLPLYHFSTKSSQSICTFSALYECLSNVPTHCARAHLETEGRSPQPQQLTYRQGFFFCSSAHFK